MVNNDAGLQETVTESPVLELADFALMLQVIDVFAQRGNLRGDELTSLGKLRDKVFKFVTAVQAASKPAEEDIKG